MSIFLVVFISLFLIFLLASGKRFFDDFFRELKFLNSEISTASGEERRYWLQQRRQLWLSLLPFVKY